MKDTLDFYIAHNDWTELEVRRRIWQIVKLASERFSMSAVMISGPCKLKPYAEARQWVYFEARQDGISLAAIGRAMGRDHTSVMHGVASEAKRRKPSCPWVFKSVRAK